MSHKRLISRFRCFNTQYSGVQQSDFVLGEITFEPSASENVSTFFQRITFPQRDQVARFMSNHN